MWSRREMLLGAGANGGSRPGSRAVRQCHRSRATPGTSSRLPTTTIRTRSTPTTTSISTWLEKYDRRRGIWTGDWLFIIKEPVVPLEHANAHMIDVMGNATRRYAMAMADYLILVVYRPAAYKVTGTCYAPDFGSVVRWAPPVPTCGTRPPTAIRAAVARSNADRSNPPSPADVNVEQGPCDVALWLTSPAKPFWRYAASLAGSLIYWSAYS